MATSSEMSIMVVSGLKTHLGVTTTLEGAISSEPYPFLLNISDREYAALGQLVIYCAHLELWLFRLACRGLNEEAADRQSRRPVTDNIDRFGALLAEVPNPDARERLARAHGVLAELFEGRNALVHGAWLVDKRDGRPIAVNPRKDRTPMYGEQAAALLPLASSAMNDIVKGMLLEKGIDFPLPVPFFNGG